MTTVLKMARSLCVSVGTTLLSAGVLVGLTLVAGVAAGPANVVATLCGIGPSYVGNRRWAWGRQGASSLRREVLPFWALSITGLVLSTVAVSRVAELGTAWPTGVRTLALPAANLAVFAALWLVQFAVLDRWLFARPAAPPAGSPVPNPASLQELSA